MGWPCPHSYPCGGTGASQLPGRTGRPPVPDVPAGRYSAAIMLVPGWSRSVLAARVAAGKTSGWVRRQFITRNRRLAVTLALATVIISVAAVHVSQAWFSPDLLILPVLAGGLLLWPRALHILFCVIAAGLTYDVLMDMAGPGLIATIVVTALVADQLARTRKKLGMQGLRGNQMLIELRDRIRAQGTLPALPEGWGSVSVLRPAGGSSFGGDFLVSACDGKTLEVALVDVAGKGLDAGTRALLLSGAFGGLLGSVPQEEFLSACNAYLRLVPERGVLRPGDALMLYTDGLVEAPGRDIDYGTDRLLGEADRLVISGFQEGAADLVRVMQSGTGGGDDCALALIWRT